MNFTFLVWLLALLLTAALLGITMYSLISLSDLENDFVNPHDSSVSINRWVVRRHLLVACPSSVKPHVGQWFWVPGTRCTQCSAPRAAWGVWMRIPRPVWR